MSHVVHSIRPLFFCLLIYFVSKSSIFLWVLKWFLINSLIVSLTLFVCVVVYFGFVFSLCCQSFSGSVTVTMQTESTQTAQVGKTCHATVNTISQTHTSSEQHLPVPTLLHYPCKICGK